MTASTDQDDLPSSATSDQGALSAVEEPRQMGSGRSSRRSAIIGAVGAIVEWYDLMLYGYLAGVFSRVFFPDVGSGLLALIATYGTFAAGYLVRPLGGVFFGWLGDAKGRKTALTTSVVIMAVPMVVTAFLPSYAVAGAVAPVLFVVMRLIQGFSVGGEYSGTLVFLLEDARPGNRGRLVSVANVFAGCGVLLASTVVLVLTLALDTSQLDSWGWRIAYGVGATVAVLGLVMRLQMQETDSYRELKESGQISEHPIRDVVRRHWRAVLATIALAGYLGLAYYLIVTFLVGFLEVVVGVSHDGAMVISTLVAVVYAAGAPLFGWLTDRVGRRPQMLVSAGLLAVLAWPAFELISTGNLALALAGEFILLLPMMAFLGASSVALVELFPARDRNSGMGIGYNLGMSALGGTAPLIASSLINATGSNLAPSWYLAGASLLIIPVILWIRETAFGELR